MIQPAIRPVTAILVAHNSAGVIADSLAELVGASAIAKIIVMDNCSYDNTCELIREKFPTVKIIENPTNEGFGKANNVGFSKVETEFALLVNPDAVINNASINALLEAAQNNPQAAILGPSLYKPQPENISLHSYRFDLFKHKGKDLYSPEPDGDVCAEFITGAVWLVRMSALRTVGYFDSNIFLYYEDDDLCMRMRKAGYSLLQIKNARATHRVGGSCATPKDEEKANQDLMFRQYHMAWSRAYIEEKYLGRKSAVSLANKMHLISSIKAAIFLVLGNMKKYSHQRGRIIGYNDFSEKRPARRVL